MADANIVVKILDQTKAGINAIDRNLNKINDSAKRSTKSLGNLRTAAVGLATALSGKAILDFVDTIQTMDNRLKIVTSSSAELNQRFNELFAVAQSTRAPLEETVELFSKLSRSSEQLGLSQQQVIDVAENFNKTLALSGASTQEAASSILQFSQALASGVLRGDEFRSLNENNTVLMGTLAKQLGITRGQLREYAGEGLLTAEIITRALLEATEDLDNQFAQTDVTVGQALTRLNNAFQELGRTYLESTGFGGLLVEGIELITEKIDILAPIVGVGLVAAFGAFVAAISPVAAGIVAVTTVVGALVIAFDPLMDIIEDVARTIYSVLGDAFDYMVAIFDGLAAALADPLNAFDAFEEAFDKSIRESAEKATEQLEKFEAQTANTGRQVRRTEAETEDFGDTVDDYTESQSEANDESKTAAEMLQEQMAQTKKTTNAYEDFIKALDKDIKLLKLDTKEREIQEEIGRALEAAAKDQKKAVEDLGEEERRQISATVREKVEQRQTQERLIKEQEESERRYNEQYEGLLRLEQRYRDENLTDVEQYNAAVAQINELTAQGLIATEEEKTRILKAIRSQYIEEYETKSKAFRDNQMTEIEKYNAEVLRITELTNAGIITSEEDKARYIEAVRAEYAQKYVDIAERQIESELTAFDRYTRDRQELQDALNAGIITSDQDRDAVLRSINQSYIDSTVTEYNDLYGLLEGKLKEYTGISQKEFGILEEVVQLTFGVNITDIIKGTFASGIKSILGFKDEGTADLTDMKGGIGSIFDGVASIFDSTFIDKGLSAIGTFITDGFSLFDGFGTAVSSVLGGLGSFISSNFSSLFDSISSGASSLISTVSGFFGGGGGGGIGATIGSFFGPVGSVVGGIVDFFFADGGYIAPGGVGIVGEAGPEIISGPAHITSTQDTADMLSNMGGSPVNVNFTINAVDARGVDNILVERKELITNIVREAVQVRGGRL